jgi:hypothetical protein
MAVVSERRQLAQAVVRGRGTMPMTNVEPGKNRAFSKNLVPRPS